MRKAFKHILRAKTFLDKIHKDGQRYRLLQCLPKLRRNFNYLRLSWVNSLAPAMHYKIKFPDNLRTYKNDSGKYEGGGMNITKILSERKNRTLRIRQAVELRQNKIKKEMESALMQKRLKLTNTGKQIRARGKLIIQDIRETKNKMKEKMEEVIERENVYTIPNLLCVTRIVFSPLLGYFIICEDFGCALGFMAVAGISDWFVPEGSVRAVSTFFSVWLVYAAITVLYSDWWMNRLEVDGYIARNYPNQSSKIGSFLDPMADKVLIGTLFMSLTYVNLIPVPLTALIIFRDAILVIAGFVIRYRSLPPPRTLSRYFDVTHATAQLAPTFISKVNTGVQLALVASTLAAPVFGYVDHPVLHGLWYVTALTTVISAASYISTKETYRYLKK